MSEWQRVCRIVEDADKIEWLAKTYMERGNVTWQEAIAWAKEQFKLHRGSPDDQAT